MSAHLPPPVAYTYVIDDANALALVRLTGTVSGPELAQATRALFGDAAWRPHYAALWDASAVACLLVVPSDLATLSGTFEACRERMGAARSAIVVASEEVGFIARLMKEVGHRRTDREIEVFEHQADALAWLGLEGAGEGATGPARA